MSDRNDNLGQRLAITACTVSDAGHITPDGDAIELMLNPASWKHHKSIRYAGNEALGKPGNDPHFRSMGEDKLGFDFLVDGTGVAAPAGRSVRERIVAFEKIVYRYQGDTHQPRVVRLLWGTLIFFGRLATMGVDYTLFKPDGDPLRARVTLSFVGFMSTEELKLRANRSSPDLSHHIVVEAGDTLPLLCQRVYEDGSYYPEVARHNGLTGFRDLEPGMRLAFPPLR